MSPIAGSGKLLALTLRRDRARIAAWLLILLFFAVAIPFVFESMFGTEAERLVMAETMANPAMISMFGPNFGIADYNTGAMVGHEMLLFTMMAVVIMNILMVVRHTRKDEELGRHELIRALPVGRSAGLFSVLAAALITNAAIALMHAVVMPLLGIESVTFAGALTYGCAIGAAGFFFAAATACAAQICGSSRGATGVSMALFGLFYMLRAAGDTGDEILSLISPMGLPLRAKAFVENSPWPLLITFGLALAVCGVAFALNAGRDLDAGLIAPRPGRTRAGKSILSPFGLALRLNRGMLTAWVVATALIGAMYGSVFGDLDSFFSENDFLRSILDPNGGEYAQQFMAILMRILAMVALVPALNAALRLRAEERRGRLEHLLSRAVPRGKIIAGYAVIAMCACAVMQFLSALGLWGAASASMETPMGFGVVMTAAMSYVPAMWLITGAAFLLIGLLPERTGLVWAYFAYVAFMGYMGVILKLPDWASGLSPMLYTARYPTEPFSVVPLIAITAAAALLLWAGTVFYRRRDCAMN